MTQSVDFFNCARLATPAIEGLTYGSNFLHCALATLVVTLTGVQTIKAQTPSEKPASNSICKVYALAELGDDPKLCKWLADTIPEMIEPTSWKRTGAKLSYYAPSKILVVNNEPAVHRQVAEFLENLKKATTAQKTIGNARWMRDSQVVPAQFEAPPAAPLQPSYQGSYPVPMQPKQPKHLFHFIIRYEGAGIIDENVVRFAKALSAEKTSEASRSVVAAPPAEVVPAPGVVQSAYSNLPSAPLAFPPGAPSEPGPNAPRTAPSGTQPLSRALRGPDRGNLPSL